MSDSVGNAVRAHVLVVEDDPTIAEVLSRYLERERYHVDTCADGLEALARVEAQMPDLIVLDLMLPGLDGVEVCRRLRAHSTVPIVMLTARGDASDRIAGLELGADDYVPKPFSPRELVARVKAVLRRTAAIPGKPFVTGPEPLTAGAIILDERARQVTIEGERIGLTVKEFDLLAFLMHRPHEAFTREALLEQVWGYTFGDTSTVTVHVRRLREKIEPDPSKPVYVETVWGVGYRFAQ